MRVCRKFMNQAASGFSSGGAAVAWADTWARMPSSWATSLIPPTCCLMAAACSCCSADIASQRGSGGPEGAFVRADDQGKQPITDGPFAETKDLIAGWYVIDVDGWDRAVELAGELSLAPGAGGKPIHEWLEVRPFYGSPTGTGD